MSDYIPDQYNRGVITEVLREDPPQEDGSITQYVNVRLKDGEVKTEVQNRIDPAHARSRLETRDSVVTITVPSDTKSETITYVSDFYRLPQLGLFAVLFFALVLVLGRKRGLTSMIGLFASIVIIFGYILPLIISGYSPLLVATTGSVMIIASSMFFAHGFNKSTTLAVLSTTITLAIATVLATIAVSLSFLFGTGTEEAMFVQLTPGLSLDIQGLLLAGIIIGALGVLDDITTAQTAAVHEIHDTKPDISRRELFMRVMRIGREHIASLVNTLVLAYVGASFPLFLLLYTNTFQPLWSIINSQQIAEEIVRTLVGSTALLLAVPISSVIAAYYYTKNK